jgi:RNA polymerase subunit RPABC4/transcription elongation factor Spt4
MFSMNDTLGDCPHCGHREASYDDWTFEGFRDLPDVDNMGRVFRCRHCQRLVTPDHPTQEGLIPFDEESETSHLSELTIR